MNCFLSNIYVVDVSTQLIDFFTKFSFNFIKLASLTTGNEELSFFPFEPTIMHVSCQYKPRNPTNVPQ